MIPLPDHCQRLGFGHYDPSVIPVRDKRNGTGFLSPPPREKNHICYKVNKCGTSYFYFLFVLGPGPIPQITHRSHLRSHMCKMAK